MDICSVLTLSAFIAIAPTLSSYETRNTITINADDFSSRLPAVGLRGHVNIPSLSFESIQHLLMAIARILKTISKHSESAHTKVQFWKLFTRFRDYVEYNESSVDKSDVCS